MDEMKLGRIGQIAITVNDMERSVAFYRDVVGLSFMFQAPNVAFFDCAGVRFMLGQSPQPDAKPSGTYAMLYQMQLLETRKAERRMVPS